MIICHSKGQFEVLFNPRVHISHTESSISYTHNFTVTLFQKRLESVENIFLCLNSEISYIKLRYMKNKHQRTFILITTFELFVTTPC